MAATVFSVAAAPLLLAQVLFIGTKGEILVVGGEVSGGEYTDDVEILALGDEAGRRTNQPCRKPESLLHPNKEMIGAFVGGRATVCGGFNRAEEDPLAEDDCFEYDAAGGKWEAAPFTLNVPRLAAASVVLPDGRWLVVGGERRRHAKNATTEVLLVNRKMIRGPAAPVELDSDPCAAPLNETHVFLSGKSHTYLLNIETWEWTFLERPRTPEGFRFGYLGVHCGRVVAPGGSPEIVLVDKEGGETAVYSALTYLWTKGMVHHGGGLLLLGGSCGGDNSASGAIWQFEKYQWTKRRDRLALPRKAAAAFEVPGCME